MEKYNAYAMTFEEYQELVNKVSHGIMGVEWECDEWFYTIATDEDIEYDEDFDEDAINEYIGEELNEKVIDVIVDFHYLKVAIICE